MSDRSVTMALEALYETIPGNPQCDLEYSIPRGLRDILIDSWKEWWKKEGKVMEWKQGPDC